MNEHKSEPGSLNHCVETALAALSPRSNETVESFAERLYNAQAEAIDEYSNFSIAPSTRFWLLDQETRNGWIERAKTKVKSCNCKCNDAWRCAVQQGLTTVSCHCSCHKQS